LQTSLEILASYVLPEGILDYFDIEQITEQKGELSITLAEKNYPPSQPSQHIQSKGFYPTISIVDFPIRDRSVKLLIRKRKWKDLDSGKVVKRDWSCLRSKGSSYTEEFGAFLKEVVG